MLAELSIKNFAIIEELTVSFERGLTVLTGETGAGKSIIIDAISLLVGGRGSSEFVRYGETKAELEGLFLLESGHPVFDVCTEQGIDVSDEMIVMRRDISTSGKSVCRVNGKLVTIASLREIGRLLLDIHGQHDNQLLMEDENHLRLLDKFAGAEVESALQAYQEGYQRYMKLLKKLKQLSESEQEMAHRLDLIQFQLEEIESAKLELNEDEQLQEERQQISNFEKIYGSLQNAYNALRSEQGGLDWVGMASAQLEDISDINEPLKKLSESVSNSYYLLEDATFQMRNMLDELEYDPERLNYIETRLNEIKQLKRKYGATVEDILEYASKIEEEIDQIENRDSHLQSVKKELDSVGKDVAVEAANVSQIRKAWAKKLADEIHRELKSLYMEKSTFDTEFKVRTASRNEEAPMVNGQPVQLTDQGIDSVKFLISTNTGEPLKSLSKVASGGELSRVMLAIKSIFSSQQDVTSIIFDEVDTGVSGRVAQAIAEKIHKVSIGSQVLCITHLPQVAAMADTHLYIAKELKDGRTTTRVKPLSKQEKVVEIGRMIAGVEVTDLTKRHAKELLKQADQVKTTG
ncbi:DNA repair protein RecN [Bacillus spizizenii ATCC 6633 = JCM 2499]|uniref:DNA repair protein RecN n=2 Tax=Bacillus spizizenii TaxID=96241 RepID=E0U3D6_BACSH|nr:DNA repair protein RecN [Bacillus spizizenii]QCJ17582.1 DNA repair protein RecN [Bacillus subtilis]ADM38437.1 factor for double strand breaks DNA repair and genetic recombination [Bacillus spizizenii str. W23]AJW84009.1 DNA recombination protein RecN [Bacillus spizizenii]EFG90514.1 factor for double strand breaks DNA repair and genetic recombination [Bacillus spizizenii ATCC 6633 = JCM 2499]KFK77333.1 DNA repair protein RecN [Bacillus spizizenii]